MSYDIVGKNVPWFGYFGCFDSTFFFLKKPCDLCCRNQKGPQIARALQPAKLSVLPPDRILRSNSRSSSTPQPWLQETSSNALGTTRRPFFFRIQHKLPPEPSMETWWFGTCHWSLMASVGLMNAERSLGLHSAALEIAVWWFLAIFVNIFDEFWDTPRMIRTGSPHIRLAWFARSRSSSCALTSRWTSSRFTRKREWSLEPQTEPCVSMTTSSAFRPCLRSLLGHSPLLGHCRNSNGP